MENKRTLDQNITDFMNVTAKSTVAVVIPLYGFWADVPDNPVNGEVLKLALSRLYSNVHLIYTIFVLHPESLPNDTKDPASVTNVLLARSRMGNMKNIPVSREATYAQYVQEGIDYALTETSAQFIAVFNPWVMIQDGGLDILIDRSNRGDDAKVVSGYDLRSIIEPQNFHQYKNTAPKEEWDLQFNLMAMPRYIAEMVTVDPTYLTHVFLERDMWQQVAQQRFAVIASERIPIFPFDFPWNDYESKPEFESDRQYFIRKWNFDPGLVYQDPAGRLRQDRKRDR